MDTKYQILKLADNYIRKDGFNAFSFRDISAQLGIKSASVHYHFPTKTDLAASVVEHNRSLLLKTIEKNQHLAAPNQLQAFFSIYDYYRTSGKICLIGSIASDYFTVEAPVREAIALLSQTMHQWVTTILEKGLQNNDFFFKAQPDVKAAMIIGNMLALLQLSRVLGDKYYESVKQEIIRDLNDENHVR
jgi:3-oxoacyl-[acyl-carrier-protein] synthase II/TetR/AcrR family transcriptional repressor of nem operon